MIDRKGMRKVFTSKLREIDNLKSMTNVQLYTVKIYLYSSTLNILFVHDDKNKMLY